METHTLFSNKEPYESEFKSLKELKKYIKLRSTSVDVIEKNTSIVRFIKFKDGQTFYYIKKRKK